MSKFDNAPVYTKDSVTIPGDDKKKQDVIDEWTDNLANRMASSTHFLMLDDGTVIFDSRERRGGHNRQTIEMLNAEGYIVKVFESIASTAKFFGVNSDTIYRVLNGTRQQTLMPGYTIRRRETEKQRREREKLTAKANKKRMKTIKNKKQ